MMLKPQTTPSLIADALRDDIRRGVLRPGAALRQEALAARFAVSRIPVRDALKQLESEGLATLLPNRGAFVTELSVDEVGEIFHLRRLIEVDLIGRAVPRMDAAALREVREKATIAEQLSDTPDWIDGDRSFHRALYVPAGSPRQLELAMSLRTAIERYEAIYRRLPQKRLSWLRDHAGLIDACAKSDAATAQARLSEHLERAAVFLVEQIKEREAATV